MLVGSSASAIPEGPDHPSPEWTEREAQNFLRTREEAGRQLTDPTFQARLAQQSVANAGAYAAFQAAHGFLNADNPCASWAFTCAGDPLRYPGTDPFYDDVGTVTEVLRYDRDCARISGRVWAPADAAPGDALPGVVITTGSVESPEPLYWWFAQALVRQGYVVMTWDVRGQGRSDSQSPSGDQGGNSDPTVFWDGTVDAVDFLHSTPTDPYPHNVACAATVPPLYALPAAAAFNPAWDVLDGDRLGLVGHSLGAAGVAVVQGMDPWEGTLAATNPVDVIVAWDSLNPTDVVPRVPAMGQSSEYGLVNVPFTAPPEIDGHLGGFAAWEDAGIPVSQLTIQGSTHYEWSLIPATPVATFSSTSWADWGRPMAEHYSLAWIDRWLKVEGEPGFATADERLLAEDEFCPRFSFYFQSARRYAQRSGAVVDDGDVRARCVASAGGSIVVDPPGNAPGGLGVDGDGSSPGDTPSPGIAATGASVPIAAAVVAVLFALIVRPRRPSAHR